MRARVRPVARGYFVAAPKVVLGTSPAGSGWAGRHQAFGHPRGTAFGRLKSEAVSRSRRPRGGGSLELPGKGACQLIGEGRSIQDDVGSTATAEAPASEMAQPTMTLGPKISCSGLSHAASNSRKTSDDRRSGMTIMMGATATAE